MEGGCLGIGMGGIKMIGEKTWVVMCGNVGGDVDFGVGEE